MRSAKVVLLACVIVLSVPAVAWGGQLTLDDNLGIVGSGTAGSSGGPMGHFNLTPKIGYMYLGGQGGYTSVTGAGSYSGQSINAMDIKLDLSWGGAGSAYSFAPYYMFEDFGTDAFGNHNYVHGVGLYNAYWYNWDVDGGNSGYWYPCIGFGTGTGVAFGGNADWGIQIYLHMPFGATWYPSKSTKVGISLEAGIGFQMTMLAANSNYFISYGVQADVMAGVKFF